MKEGIYVSKIQQKVAGVVREKVEDREQPTAKMQVFKNRTDAKPDAGT